MKTCLLSLHATRPQYSKQVLDALDHQCGGLYHIAGLEFNTPHRNEINEIIQSKRFRYTGTTVVYNTGIPHTNNNLICALKYLVRQDFDSFIYMEDDTLFSKGAVKYLLSELELLKDKKGLSHIALCTSEDGLEVTDENLGKSTLNYTWCSMWGYAAPISMAHKLLELTVPIDTLEKREEIRTVHGQVWDQTYSDYFLKNGLYCVTPVISRMQNIGKEGGLHREDHVWASWEGQLP